MDEWICGKMDDGVDSGKVDRQLTGSVGGRVNGLKERRAEGWVDGKTGLEEWKDRRVV